MSKWMIGFTIVFAMGLSAVCASLGTLLVADLLHADEENALEAAKTEIETLKRREEALNQYSMAHEELQGAQNRIAELEAELAEAQAAAKSFDTASAVDETEPAESDPETASQDRSLDAVRKAIRDNPGASAQLKALTEMYYAGVLNNLQLDNETKSALRELLTDSQIEETALMQHAMQSGDLTWKDVAELRNAERARLDEQVHGLLSADDYAQWSAHFAAIDEHTLDAVLRNQIRTVASGLTSESFDAVMQVAVEEFRHEQLTLEQSDVPFNVEENVNYQLRAMDAMRTRLEGFLSPEQYTELENWLTMGENMLRASVPQN